MQRTLKRTTNSEVLIIVDKYKRRIKQDRGREDRIGTKNDHKLVRRPFSRVPLGNVFFVHLKQIDKEA